MQKYIIILLGIVSVGILIFVQYMPEEIKAVANPVSNCPSDIFDKSAVVFDSILICGTAKVPQEKLSHAANVAAKWLDNDENGSADEPSLRQTLKQNNPLVVMTQNENESEMVNLDFEKKYLMQDLYATETANPERDAAPEEIHHLIMNAGWQKQYPDIFSEVDKKSKLYQTWQLAEKNGYYSYDDPTCDDSCKVTEFVYMATSSYLGAKDSLLTDEITLNTKKDLQANLPSIIEIIESPKYVYPVHVWPDGQYKHSKNIVYN